MALPSALVTPSERRSPSGSIEPALAGLSGASGASWSLRRGLGEATLLLSPDGSFDQNGPVEPSVGGAVDIVPGRFGNAWLASSRSGVKSVTVPALPYFADMREVTIFLRWKYTLAAEASSYVWAVGSYGNEFLGWLNYTNNQGVRIINSGSGGGSGGSGGISHGDLTEYLEQVVTGAVRAKVGEGRTQWIEDVVARTNSYSVPVIAGTHRFGFGNVSTAAGHQAESILVYDHALTDAEVHRIMSMARAWEWGPNGSLTVPLAATPGEVYVRYRRDGITLTARLTESGPLGEVGHAEITASGVTITATEDIEVLGVLAYEAPLPPYERSRVEAMDRWRWEHLVPQLGGILRVPSPDPIMISRVPTAEPIAVSRVKPVEPIVISRIPGEM